MRTRVRNWLEHPIYMYIHVSNTFNRHTLSCRSFVSFSVPVAQPSSLPPPLPPSLSRSRALSLARSLALSLSLSLSVCVCVCVCPLPVSNPTYLQDHEHKAPFALDAFVATASVLPGDPRSFPLKNLALSSRAGAPTRVCKHSTHTTAHTSAHTCMYTHMNTYTTQCMHARV